MPQNHVLTNLVLDMAVMVALLFVDCIGYTGNELPGSVFFSFATRSPTELENYEIVVSC